MGDTFLLWENLVTDGHVLAAQLRRIAPWLLGAAIILLIVSVSQPATGLSSPWAWKTATSSQIIEDRRTAYMQPIIDRLNATPGQEFTWQQLRDLAPVEEIPAVVEEILRSLNSGGGMPTPKLFLREVPASTFWSWEWTPQNQSNETDAPAPTPNADGKVPDYIVVAKGAGDTYSLGAFARLTTQDSNGTASSRPIRWVAVARKFADGWKLVSINWSNFYLPTQSATVSEIPVSLRLALNLPEPQ